VDPRTRRAFLLKNWPPGDLLKARRKLVNLLDGAGEGENFWGAEGEYVDSSEHLRRKLTAAERAKLSPDWLEIPAVDPG
jgi:hypothetical protein